MVLAPEYTAYQELKRLIRKKLPGVDLERIDKAYEFANSAHAGQFRMSGEPYICHPIEAAKILADLRADEDAIIATLLHDVPEDTTVTIAEVEKEFGKTVSRLVDAVTKLAKVHYQHSMDEREVDSLRKMFLETANDVRVVIIKLADRLHNMRTIQYLRPDKQQRIAKETMEIFAPLANLYGIFQIRRQLEDLSFAVLQPDEYGRIEAFVSDHEKNRSQFVRDTIAVLKKALIKAGIPAEFEGRPKHYYSIYQKMVARHKVLADIYDYFAVRIIVKNSDDCYRALGIVHASFHPKPGRFKDYIAFPKPNGYQSLHTTIIGLEGKLSEIQIRSVVMHEEAEFGAASHAIYKNWKNTVLAQNINRLKKYKLPGNFIKNLHEDILQNRIYVFASNGDIVNLPVGATCIDFIYAEDIPTDKRALKPIVNNKQYSLFGELQSGDHVQILFLSGEQNGPERGWLDHVKTAKAREKIQNFFKKKNRFLKIDIGTTCLQQQLDHENQVLVQNLSESKKQLVIKKFRFKTFEDVLASIGEGTLEVNEVYKVMFPELPLGYLMAWRKRINEFGKRFNFGKEEYKYRIRIVIDAYDRRGLLKEIIHPFYDLKIPIMHIRGTGHDAKTDRIFLSDGTLANMDFVSNIIIDVFVEDHEGLVALFDRLEKIPGMIRVRRSFRESTAPFITLCFFIGGYLLWHPFAINVLLKSQVENKSFWLHTLIYVGLFSLFAMMIWLRTMGNKTFPHFEETKAFWPLAFGLSFLAIGVVFIDNLAFELHLHLPLTIAFSFSILVFLMVSYLRHVRQRRRHLNRLESSHQKSDVLEQA